MHYCVCVYLYEGCGSQHRATEGARSGRSGVREEPKQQSNICPGILFLSLQVNVPTTNACIMQSCTFWQLSVKLVSLTVFMLQYKLSCCFYLTAKKIWYLKIFKIVSAILFLWSNKYELLKNIFVQSHDYPRLLQEWSFHGHFWTCDYICEQ